MVKFEDLKDGMRVRCISPIRLFDSNYKTIGYANIGDLGTLKHSASVSGIPQFEVVFKNGTSDFIRSDGDFNMLLDCIEIAEDIKTRGFEKVSFEQYREDFLSTFPDYLETNTEVDIKIIYNEIKLPERKTRKSAGYDFHIPFYLWLEPNKDFKIPTGIRCIMEDDEVLMLYPRSSLGFKYYMRIANTTPVIDADYYESDNEGHIFVKIRNEGQNAMELLMGDAFVQGVFSKYLTTDDDNVTNQRNGGIGSTSK
jgi:dUTP pyrophosphatase